MTIDTTTITLDWSGYTPISFLTGWETASITAENHGVSNYTYRINATEGNMGVFYACETYLSEAQVQWQVEQVRFKYPSEHIIDGKQYAMEMQVVLNDTLNRCVYCSGHMGVLSLFFDIAEEPVNDFWDFVGQDTFDLDLSKIWTKTTSMEAQMVGYGGSDSQPTCEMIWCWYIAMFAEPLTIPQAKFDALTKGATGLDWNNRAVDLGMKNYLTVKFPGLLYVAPTDEL